MLKKICWFAVLTPSYSTAEGSSSDAATLAAATAGDKRLADALPLFKQLLDTFATAGARFDQEITQGARCRAARRAPQRGCAPSRCCPHHASHSHPTPPRPRPPPHAEIIRWPLFEATYGPEMAAAPEVFGDTAEGGAKRREDLQLRVVEHNVLTVAKYYTRISMARLAELLALPVDKVCAGL